MDEWSDVEIKHEAKFVVVTVSESDIANGIRHPFDFKTDPVSMAIQRATRSSFAISGWAVADTWSNQIKTSWNLWPWKNVRDWCQDWQYGRPVEPFSFRMYKDREVDVSVKNSKKPPRRHKPMIETVTQHELGLK